jgi:hypothetical protein
MKQKNLDFPKRPRPSIASFFVLFVLVWPIEVNSQDFQLPTIQLLRDKILSNRGLVGSLDLQLDVSQRYSEYSKSTPIKLVPVEKHFLIKSSFAVDGSIKASVEGDLGPHAAREYVSNKNGLVRYYPEKKFATNGSSESIPEVLLDPFRALRTSGNVTVNDAMLKHDTTDVRVEPSSETEGDVAVSFFFTHPKLPPKTIEWRVVCSKESNYLPIEFKVFLSAVLVESGKQRYVSLAKNRAFLIESWELARFSGERKVYEENGVVKLAAVHTFGTLKSFDFVPKAGVTFSDKVNKKVSVAPEHFSFRSVSWHVYAAVIGLVCLFGVFLIRRIWK